jgi:sulfate transport system permease protein
MASIAQTQHRAAGAPHSSASGVATSESAVVRWVLIGIAVAFLVIFLFFPLAVVFGTAFQKGIAVYFRTFRDPDTQAAIRLTLLAAAISVPPHG